MPRRLLSVTFLLLPLFALSLARADEITELTLYRTDEQIREIAREVDRVMAGRDVRTPVAEAVAEDLRDRYPDMPEHLARGLGATYAAVTEMRDRDAIDLVRRETELRERHGVTDARHAARDESAARHQSTAVRSRLL